MLKITKQRAKQLSEETLKRLLLRVPVGGKDAEIIKNELKYRKELNNAENINHRK